MNNELKEKLESYSKEKKEILEKLSDQNVLKDMESYSKLLKRLKEVDKWVNPLEELAKIERHLNEDNEIINNELDNDIIDEAQKDLNKNESKKQSVLKQIEDLENEENKSEDDDVSKIILEIRAGTGGDEATLFAFDLYRMYSRFSEIKGFDMVMLDSNENNVGGFKEVVAEIKGKLCFKLLKNEAGVHRVQRVPSTEKQGRIHTSTATVVILPKVDAKKVEIKETDLEIEFYKASGHGGQNIQKVETAVRIKHKPTGIVVQCQVERFQHKNRELAMDILRAKLWEDEKERHFGNVDDARRDQVKGAKRCEKIRTYNYPQDRITDHRINQSFHNIEGVLAGNLDDIIEATSKLEFPDQMLVECDDD